MVLLAQPHLAAALHLPPRPDGQEQPWSLYWATRLQPTLHVAVARERLAHARVGFAARADLAGELLCLAAIIEGFYVEEGSLEPLDAWVPALEQCLPAAGAWPSDELEAWVMACGIGLRLRHPRHALLQAWAARGGTLLRHLRPGAARLKLATFLAQHHLGRGELGRAGLIVEAVPGLDLRTLQPAEALVWLNTLVHWCRLSGEAARGQAAVAQALALMQQHGLDQQAYALHAHAAALALVAQDAPTARAHAQAMRRVLDIQAQPDQTQYWHMMAGVVLLEGDNAQALELARMALDNSGEIGGPARLAAHLLSLGQVLLRSGDALAALPLLADARERALEVGAALGACTAELMRAACLLRLGRPADAQPALARGWGEVAQREFRTLAGWQLPEVEAELAREALAHEIEPAAVRRHVLHRALPGPDPAQAEWPWVLALHSLGGFGAQLHGTSLTRAGTKTAQRPLDLLRALLAHGSVALPVAQACDWLWPEADPAAQRKSFDVTLMRLRRMLGDPRLLQLEGGRLWLDPRWCWSDVAALHTLAARIADAREPTRAQLQAWARQLLALLRGPFLDGEDAAWVLAARERWRRRGVEAVARLAEWLEPHDADEAARLFESALDAEPLAEAFSRRLMRLYARRGEHAQALRVWRRCYTLLAMAEGVGPSAETRALAQSLGLPDWRPPSV